MPPFILAIDIGTSSTKALAITNRGHILYAHQVAYPTHFPKPRFAEQDPDEILAAVKACISQTLTQVSEHPLLAISFSAVMHSLLAVDEQAAPLTQLLIWSDLRSIPEAEELLGREDASQLYQTAGTPIHPMLPLCKIMWMKKHWPAVVSRAFKFISIKDYVLFHLTGRWLTDYSVAGSSGLFDIHEQKWNPLALKMANISIDQLPELVPSTFATTLSSALAQEFKLPDNTKVIVGASDGCLANLGTNVVHAGELAITIGTSGAVRMTVDQPLADPTQSIFSYRLDQEKVVIGGATNNGAVLLSWFEQNFGRDGDSIFNEVDRACQLPPEDLIFLPYLQGERAPIYDPYARGVFFGLHVTHNRQQLLAALIEGVCFSLYSIACRLKDVAGDYKVIWASGGFIQSEGWLQLLSTVFGKVVKISTLGDASAKGAARLAFQVLGITDHFFDDDHEVKIFKPDGALHGVYMKKFQIFLSLYRNLKQDFYNLSKLKETGL